MATTGVENGVLDEKSEIRKSRSQRSKSSMDGDDTTVTLEGKILNSSGHPDQLHRQYGLLSICGLALTVDNAWVAVGTSLAISIYNGGAPGVIWELWIAAFYYAFINASIAEVWPASIGFKTSADSSVCCSLPPAFPLLVVSITGHRSLQVPDMAASSASMLAG